MHIGKHEAMQTNDVTVQVLLGKSCCTEKVDMYSYGVVLWELCTGESPSGRQLRPVR